MKNVYFKVTLPGEENGFIDTKDGIVSFLEVMSDNRINGDEDDDGFHYEIKAVLMTDEEYTNLPEFKGF